MTTMRFVGALVMILMAHGLKPALAEEPPQVTPSGECRVHGKILSQGDIAIEGATVVLEPTGRSVVSSADGSYCLRDVPPGTYILHVEMERYSSEHTGPIEVPLGSGHGIDIRLTRIYVLEEEVVTTATRTRRNLADLPIRVEVVDREEIDKVAARTLADAIEFSTGVNVESNCQNCNFSQVRMLGLDGAYCQILFDGQPTVSSLAAVYGIEHIPSRMIDRLEIVKGGGSALYGPGSVAGVINVIPRQPKETSGEFETRFSWMEGHPSHSISGSVDVAQSEDFTLTLFGQTDRVRPVDLTGDGFTEVSSREFEVFGLRVQRSLLGDRAELTADFNRTTEQRRGGDRLDLPEFRANIAESINSRRSATQISWEHQVRNALDYKLTLSHADTDRDTYYGSGMDLNAYGASENPLTILDAILAWRKGSHEITFGSQYSVDRIQDRQPAYDRVTDATYSNAAVFAQDTWSVARGWEAIGGVRLDRHSEVDRPIASPRLALKHELARTLSVRSSVSTGFRAPQVFDEDLHITQAGGEAQVIRNDPELTEESSVAYMVGLEWTPLVRDLAFMVETNAFLTTITDQFFVEEDDDPNTPDQQDFTRVNLGGARVYGLETNLSFNLSGHLTGDLGYVLQGSRFDSPEPDFGTRDFFRTPESYGSFSLTWSNPRIGEVFVGGKYTGSMKVPHYISDPRTGEEIDAILENSHSFLTIDVSVSREMPISLRSGEQVTLMAGVKNLTNEYQEDLDQGKYRDSAFVYGPRFPRSFYVSTKVRL